MKQRLSRKEVIIIGSMLFGLFFGAGNLIFPIQLGQNVGNEMLKGTAGFLLTGVGLPFLGVVAIAVTQSTGVFQLASKVNRSFAYLLTVLLYLTIGPAFALPRLAAVAFEIGFSPYIATTHQSLGLLLFSIVFYSAAFYLSMSSLGIMNIVGKWINPFFVGLLGFLMVIALLNPMGSVTQATPTANYVNGAFLNSFVDGYQTMDALAALAFGVVIINTLNELGVKDYKERAKSIIKTGSISVILMVIIYSGLIYLGASSRGVIEISENGGIALAQIVLHYFKQVGHVLVALIVTLGCLKTAIGLINACSQSFSDLTHNRISLKKLAIFVTVASGLVANFGLSTIISLAVPVLMFIYPLVIALIFVGLLAHFFDQSSIIYQSAITFTLFASIGDFLNALPVSLKESNPINNILKFYQNYIPFFNYQMGWVLFLVVGFSLGVAIWWIKQSRNTKLHVS